MKKDGGGAADKGPNLAASRGGRRLLFALLYFTEGAPIGFLWWALPVKLREAGVEVGEITALSAMLALPWSLKFLWAPLIDLSVSRRRRWIICAQAVMALTLAPLGAFDLSDVRWLWPLLLAHAVAAATQDAAIDAYAIAVTPESERGVLTSAMQAGMLSGRWLFGAGLLAAAGFVPDGAAVAAMVCAICLVCGVVLAASRETPRTAATPSQSPEFRRALKDVLKSRNLRLGLWIALLGGSAFEGFGALAGPYLVDYGLSEIETGWFFSATALLMAAGALAGGAAADRLGPRLAVVACIAVTAAAVTCVAAAAASGSAVIVSAGAVYLALGALTAASYALFMNLSDPRLAGTQFSAYMSATNLCEAWTAFLAGRVAGSFGYPQAFLLGAVLSLLAIPAAYKLQR